MGSGTPLGIPPKSPRTPQNRPDPKRPLGTPPKSPHPTPRPRYLLPSQEFWGFTQDLGPSPGFGDPSEDLGTPQNLGTSPEDFGGPRPEFGTPPPEEGNEVDALGLPWTPPEIWGQPRDFGVALGFEDPHEDFGVPPADLGTLPRILGPPQTRGQAEEWKNWRLPCTHPPGFGDSPQGFGDSREL